MPRFLYIYIFIYLFIYLAAPGLICTLHALSCGMWDLAPRSGMEPGPTALGAWSLSHCSAMEVPASVLFQ